MDMGRHGDVSETTQPTTICRHAELKISHGLAMALAFPEDVSPSSQRLGEASHPVPITCLQWDCDGALILSEAGSAGVAAPPSRPGLNDRTGLMV
jgi:hypothetical protein